MTSPFSDTTPHRSIQSVHTHLLYHVAQAKQAQHGSLVDRGANGGLQALMSEFFQSHPENVLLLG